MNFKLDKSLKDIVDIIKLRPGGISSFVDQKLRAFALNVQDEDIKTVRFLRKMRGGT